MGRSGGRAGDGPIFLAGVDRSGIGLLGEVLECHPDVAMTRRTNFWAYYAGRFGDLDSPQALDRCLSAMMSDSRLRVLEPDRERLRADLAGREVTDARLFECLQLQRMHRLGASRWGDKSLGAERHAETILSAYPSARMVHVLRDPRDRYASVKLHRGLGRGGLGAAAATWRWSCELASELRGRHPDRYTVVRYEDLVTEPEEALRSVAGFLELDDAADTGLDPVPFTTASIGRHLLDVSAAERRFLEATGRAHMSRWGYRTGGRRGSARDRLRFWTAVGPAAAAQYGGWLVSERVDGRGRRNPSRERVGDRRSEGAGR